MASKQTIKAVVWDMGGVILRTMDMTPRAVLAKRVGMSAAELEKFVFTNETARLAEVGKVAEEAAWKFALDHFGLPKEEMPSFVDDFFGGDRFDLALIEFIKSLKPAHKVGLLSNAWSGARESVTRRLDFLGVFDVVIFSAEVKLAKPDPAIYTLMVKQLGLEPGEVVFIDDIQGNVNGAKAIGMHAIRFENTRQVENELQSLLSTH